MDTADILKILERNGGDRDGLISTLGDIQQEYGYIPEEALRIISENTRRSLIDLYSVTMFYKAFSLEPRGKNIIHVCLGTACHVRGAVPILEEIERKLNVKAGETTPDREFTLETVNCLGACALGPIVVVNGEYHGNTTIQMVNEILGKYGYVCDEDEVIA